MNDASSRGQAQIELLACLPALLLAGLIAAQLLVAAYSQSLGDGAAEAGAIALADGREVEQAATDAMPDWAAGRIEVEVDGSVVVVVIRVPALVPGLGDRLELRSDAYALAADG